jgi:hypothetical protein
MTLTIILTNNNQNINLVDFLLNNLKNYDYSREENIISQTIRLETINTTQQGNATLVYNSNGTPITLTKTAVINYETAMRTDPAFIANMTVLLADFQVNMLPIIVYYNNATYRTNKYININGVNFYFLDPIVL